MQATFMVKLMVSLIDELKSKGFEICNTDVTEDEIKDLTFQNDDSDYNIAIFTENEEQREYLKVAGGVKKRDSVRRWISSRTIDERTRMG